MLPAFHAAQLLRLYASAQRFAARRLGCYGYGYAFTASASAQATRCPVATLRSSNAATHRPPLRRQPGQAAPPPPPIFAGAGPPPYAPMDPGTCRAHTGGFPLRVANWDLELQCLMPLSNNLDNISKDGE